MAAAGVESFVELGGKVVGPMISRSAGPDVAVSSVVSMADIEELAKSL
jgi:[acyl-carrier-protein] S-malonyltransferase